MTVLRLRVTSCIQGDDLECYVGWLDKLAVDFARRDMMEKVRTRYAYKMEYLIRALTMTGTVHHRDVRPILVRALRLALPDQVANYFVAKVQEPEAILSVSSLYRHRLTLHVGWMLVCREDNQAAFDEEFARYFTVDASPVAGKEWAGTFAGIGTLFHACFHP